MQSSYVPHSEGYGATTQMSRVGAAGRGHEATSRPAWQQHADFQDPYVPDEEDDDEEAWAAVRGMSAPAPRAAAPAHGPPANQWGPNQGGPMYQQPPPVQQQQQQQQWGPQGSYQSAAPPQQALDVAAPMCLCGQPATMLTSNSAANPNRPFYRCSKPRGDPTACKFFKWQDELGTSPGNATTGNAGGAPSYGGSQGGSGYNPGFAGYGGGGAAPPQNFQAAADTGALRDKSNDVCYKCQQPGHWSRDCPNQGGGGGGGGYGAGAGAGGGSYGGSGKTGTCFKCGREGHWSRDCPNQGGGGGGYGGGAGYGGGGGGGSSYGGGGGGGGGEKTGSTCFKCGEAGHWARDCPNQGGGGGGGGSYGGGGAMRGGGNYGGGSRYEPYGGGGGRGGGRGGKGKGGGDGACFKCGQSGHWTANCPNK